MATATLHDLRALRGISALVEGWLVPALAALDRGEIESLRLDFEDGMAFALDKRQRWRFWRKPLAGLDA
jgi:hypothetical protein